MFQALLLEKGETFSAAVKPVDETSLPAGDVLVKVDFSTLNYKDGLAITQKGPVVRNWPMVAGIDGAGTVLESTHPAWKPGDAFVHNGWGVGETHWGCLAEKARLKGDWLVKLPAAFTARQAMAIGTAGYTAALCVDVLERWGHAQPGTGQVLVTGAAGGVGSVAVSLLARRGYNVTASTGRPDTHDYLHQLARDTRRFFEEVVSAADHHLPPDNLQLDPEPMLAHRTSPTNVGLYLSSCLCAHQLRLIDSEQLVARLAATLATLAELPRWHGHFWGRIEMRPYMRALGGLAELCWMLGNRPRARALYARMLELNQSDNQGIRYMLATCLLEERAAEAHAALKKLLSDYPNDAAATWAYSRALLAFQEHDGPTPNATRALRKALKANKHVPGILLGDQPIPLALPRFIGFGDESEAIEYVTFAVRAWTQTPGSIAWLRDTIRG